VAEYDRNAAERLDGILERVLLGVLVLLGLVALVFFVL